jgi:transposase
VSDTSAAASAKPTRRRSMLVEVARRILRRRNPATQALDWWDARIAQRRGKKIAAVVVARKLAGILYAMWRDGTSFGAQAARAGHAGVEVAAA